MARRAWLFLLLSLWAAPLAAQNPAPLEGVYQSQTIEVGSGLVLAPDGRFVWQFAYGSLDLSAEGRWARESDGVVVLTSDPTPVAPAFELVGRSRDQQPGVAIRLPCDTGDVRYLLNVITEHADGLRVRHSLSALELRTSNAETPSPVTAVQLASESFGFASERFAVNPQEANVLNFRFVPNDLGRVDFRDVRVGIAGGVLNLTLEWLGLTVRYRREGSAAGQELPELPSTAPPPREVDGTPFPLDLGLYEDAAALKARAGAGLTDNDRLLVATAPIDLRLSHEGRGIDIGRIEGVAHPLIVQVDVSEDGRDNFIGGYSFAVAPQTLEAALAQAQALKAWLEQAGFAVLPSADDDRRRPFEVTGADLAEPMPTDWASAARLLADEAEGVTEMRLFILRTPERGAEVRIENGRRSARERCPHAEWPDGGRDWRLQVELSRTLAPVQE